MMLLGCIAVQLQAWIFFANKIHFFTTFVAFSQGGVSSSQVGLVGSLFGQLLFTTRAFFTPNRLPWIGPFPGHTNVPTRPPPQKKHTAPLPHAPPLIGNPDATHHSVDPIVSAWHPVMVCTSCAPQMLRSALPMYTTHKFSQVGPGGVSFSPDGVSFSPTLLSCTTLQLAFMITQISII